MENNIDKDEIRRAIDRLQAEHPCGINYDPTAFVNMEAVNTIKGCIDRIAKRMMEDTEINIICEFAKLYLEGVRPMIEPKQERSRGEWSALEYGYKCSVCTAAFYTHSNFCPNCGSDNRQEEAK
mgnify:CR=1 FL=1